MASLASVNREKVEAKVRREMERSGRPGPPPGTFGLRGLEFMTRVEERLRANFAVSVDRFKKEICEAACVRFDYCEKRRRGELEGWQIAAGVADALLMSVSSLPLPAATVAVYLVKRRVLDRWSDCQEDVPTGEDPATAAPPG